MNIEIKNISESIERDVDKAVKPFLDTYSKQLSTDIQIGSKTAYMTGSSQMLEYGKTKGGRAIVLEGKAIAEATKWAEEKGATLITGMNDETKRRIADTIRNGIVDKKGIDGIEKDLRSMFSDMSESRANMIAMTETNDALSQAFIDRSNDMGVTGKEVVTIDPCPICQENAAVGVIATNEEFPSGHLRPSFHPNCQCALAPVMLKTSNVSGKNWINSLSEDEKDAMLHWQGSAGEVRKFQQTGVLSPKASITKEQIMNLESALNKSQPYRGSVYRGLSDLDERTFDFLKNAKTMKWDALSSGTKDERIAMKFMIGDPSKKSAMFKIVNKTGIDITDISDAFSLEKEVIMRKNAVYKVINTKVTRPLLRGVTRDVLEVTLMEV